MSSLPLASAQVQISVEPNERAIGTFTSLYEVRFQVYFTAANCASKFFTCDHVKVAEIAPVEIKSTGLLVMPAALSIEKSEFNQLASDNLVLKATNTEPHDWQLDLAQIQFFAQYLGSAETISSSCMTDHKSYYNGRFVVKSDIAAINGAYAKVSTSRYYNSEKDVTYYRAEVPFSSSAEHIFEDASGNVVAKRVLSTNGCMTGSADDVGPWVTNLSPDPDVSIRFFPSKPHFKIIILTLTPAICKKATPALLPFDSIHTLFVITALGDNVLTRKK